MAKQTEILLYIVVLFSTQLLAGSPFGRSLILNGAQQYFEIPDSLSSLLDYPHVLTVELRFKTDHVHPYTLVNNWKSYSYGNNEYLRGTWAGAGWLMNLNRTIWKIDRKIEMKYMDVLDSFVPDRECLQQVWARVHADGGGWGYSASEGGIWDIHDDHWHHLALVFDVFGNSNFTAHIDGIIESSTNNPQQNPALVDAPICVGGYTPFLDATLDLSAYFTGQIDEVRVWNKVVSPTVNDTVDVNADGLVAYYRFEDIIDGIVQDLSPSGIHGKVHNGAELTPVTATISDDYEIPVTYQLYQNSPNPFNPSTKIAFNLPKAGPVSIWIYNVQGQLVEIISDSRMDAGSHEIQWSGAGLPSGVYLCKMQSGDFNKVVKMVLQK